MATLSHTIIRLIRQYPVDALLVVVLAWLLLQTLAAGS